MSHDNTISQPDEATEGLARPGALRNRLIGKAKAAAGKAFIVYLATGSLGAAVVAFIVFKMLGC